MQLLGDVGGQGASSPRPTPFTSYQKVLFFFLSVATFFEGYDFFALAQILPNLRSDMHLSHQGSGALVAVINLGMVLAWFLVRKADAWGRRRLLTATILGYTLFTVLSGFAPNVYLFALFQFFARVFLAGEYAVAMVYAAEEFPAERRGMVIGVIQACSSLGAILCAALVPALLRTPLGWRAVYFVGGIPLLIIAYARRGLKETNRFSTQVDASAQAEKPLLHIFRTPYRLRVIQMALVWGLTYTCTQNAMVFWKDFVVNERGWTDGQVGWGMSLAALISMPLVFASGKLLDLVGRRPGSVVIFGTTAVAIFGAYTFHSPIMLTVSLVFGIFGASAVLPVMNTFTSELFPTSLRGDAYAWANNLLGRTAGVIAPFIIGQAAAVVGWGPAVSFTAIFPLLALGTIWFYLPETNRRELEDTCAIPENGAHHRA